ncbi:MAG: hypothetical protein LBC33_01125 [Mycoplasmataceae bacterium]|jgi:phosphotransferase system IIB component|nr:hypothetical protein [Mycoplasmataceae bacterium]
MIKIKYYLLCVITFGILPLVLNRRARRLAKVNHDTLTVTATHRINLDDLLKLLGGVSNLQDVNATITSLTVVLANPVEITQEAIKPFRFAGFYKANANKYIFLTGDNATAIKDAINVARSESNVKQAPTPPVIDQPVAITPQYGPAITVTELPKQSNNDQPTEVTPESTTN